MENGDGEVGKETWETSHSLKKKKKLKDKMNLNTQMAVHVEYRRLGDGDLRRRGGEGDRRLRAGEGERLFLKEHKCKIHLTWFF